MQKANKTKPGSIFLGSEIVAPLRSTITCGSLNLDAALGGGWATAHWNEIIGQECLCPGTKILCADLVWRPIEDLHVGAEIIGFDEDQAGRGRGRTSRYRRATVDYLGRKDLPVYEIVTPYGTTLASEGHLWLAHKNTPRSEARLQGTSRSLQRRWVRTDELKVGNRIASLGAPWNTEQSWEAGWLAGFYDGEGSVAAQDGRVSVNQAVGPTADFARQMLDKTGFQYHERFCKRSKEHWQDQISYKLAGRYEDMRFLGSVRPQRLLEKAHLAWEGKSTKAVHGSTVPVLDVRFVGTREVVTIETSTKTLVADGLLSHNSSGKTYLVLKTIAANQAIDPDFTVVWFATEDFNDAYAKMLGVDVDRILVVNEVLMEVVYQHALDFLKTKGVDLMVIDSLPFLVSAREDDGDMDASQPGQSAFLTGKFFRKSMGSVKRNMIDSEERVCTGLVINGWREKIGVSRGDPRVAPGGKGKNFVFYQRVDVSRSEWITNSREQPVGQVMRLRNIKNKFARPGLIGMVDAYVVDYKGHKAGEFDLVKDSISAGIAYGVIEHPDALHYSFADQVFNGRPKMELAFAEDKGLQTQLRKAVLARAVEPIVVDDDEPEPEPPPAKPKATTRKKRVVNKRAKG
jgi:recombination protein RecA